MISTPEGRKEERSTGKTGGERKERVEEEAE